MNISKNINILLLIEKVRFVDIFRFDKKINKLPTASAVSFIIDP